VGLWKNIRKGWEIFIGLFRFEVGDGARTKFWHDMWCGYIVLKEAFPVLFGIARAKDASIADNLELLGGSNQWSVSFSREAHDRKIDVFASFFQVALSHCSKLDRGVEPKGVAPAQPSSQALSSSDQPWVRMNVGQSSDLGGVDQQEQECIKPDPKGKAIAQPSFLALSSSDRLPVRRDVGQSSDLEATSSSIVPPVVLRSSLLSGNSRSVGGSVGPTDSSDLMDLMSVVAIG